jgi:hypothetical protein
MHPTHTSVMGCPCQVYDYQANHGQRIEHVVGLFGPFNSALDCVLERKNAVSSAASYAACASSTNITGTTTTNPGASREMESTFCSVTLILMGNSLFNYEFGSVTSESPLNIGGSGTPSTDGGTLLEFTLGQSDGAALCRKLRLIHNVMDDLIARAKKPAL